MAVGTVIAAVSLDPAAVGINGIKIAATGPSFGMGGFEQHTAVAEHVADDVIPGRVSQPKRLATVQGQKLDLKTLRRATGVDDPIGGQIKRRNRIFRKLSDAPRCTAANRNFPDLPGTTGLLLSGEQNTLTVERYGGIRGRGKLRHEWALAPLGDQLERRTGWKPLGGKGIVARSFCIKIWHWDLAKRRGTADCKRQPTAASFQDFKTPSPELCHDIH